MNKPQRAFFVSLFSLLSTLYTVSAQSVIVKQVSGANSRHTITSLNYLRPDQYNIAVNDQLGILGNNFFGDQVLTVSTNHNSWESTLTPTDYFTLYRPGPKMTFCGKVLQQEFSHGHVDDDLNIQIVCDPRNPAFEPKYSQLKARGRNLYPWALIEGEIDVNGNYHKFYDPGNSNFKFPVVNNTDVCLYGPWVEEVYQGDEDINPYKDHADVHEIHPAEQYWWAEKTQSGFRYYLNAANDASGRFRETGWASNPTKNTFAIAFDLNLNIKEKLVYEVSTVCDNGVTPLTVDGKKHYLLYGRDTLLEVHEPGDGNLISVTFEQVGLDPYAALANKADSVIKGFVTIQGLVTSNASKGDGNLKLIVDKKRVLPWSYFHTMDVNHSVLTAAVKGDSKQPIPLPSANNSSPKRVRVTLKEISTLDNFLGNHLSLQGQDFFNLTGYIFVTKTTNASVFSKSASLILDEKPQLLFPNSATQNNRVIKHSFFSTNHVRTSTYSNSVTLALGPTEKVNVMSDFEAGYVASFVRTLDLVAKLPYSELQVNLSELRKNMPLTKEIVLENSEPNSSADPKRYKMKIKLEFLLMD